VVDVFFLFYTGRGCILINSEKRVVKKRIKFLSIPLDPWTMDETVQKIRLLLRQGEVTQHVVINVAKIVSLRNDSLLKNAVINSDIINADGMGVVWGARFMGFDVPERVSGIDLFYRLLGLSAEEEFPVYFLGAESEIVNKTSKILKKNYPSLIIAGFHDGYFWDDEQKMVNKINDSGAKLLFVAITSPKKEKFINKWQNQLGVDFVMGVGGTFDVVAGKVERAPVWMQNYGLEWLFRVIQEPRRMWKRYLVSNAIFIWLLVREKFKL